MAKFVKPLSFKDKIKSSYFLSITEYKQNKEYYLALILGVIIGGTVSLVLIFSWRSLGTII